LQVSIDSYLKGYVALYAGDYKTALEELLVANQDNAYIQCMIGQTYERLGDEDKALEYCRKASTAISHNPAAALVRPTPLADCRSSGNGLRSLAMPATIGRADTRGSWFASRSRARS